MFRQKIFKTLIIATTSICFIASLQRNISSQEDNFIRPGIGVGKLELGETNEDINKILKTKFDDIKKVGRESDFEMWLSYKNMGLTLIYNKDKMLDRILVTNKALLVENTNIGVGSSITDLREYRHIFMDEVREIKDINKKRNIESWDYENLGIKFWINWNDKKVFAIEVKERK